MPGTENPDAFSVGQLGEALTDGFMAHVAAIRIARDPRAVNLLPPVEPGQVVPVGRLPGEVTYHFAHYLEKARLRSSDDFDRVALSGALLTLGDALASHRYFDHAPELEMLRHLRNGVAHGNRFNIDKRGREALAKWPANNQLASPDRWFRDHASATWP